MKPIYSNKQIAFVLFPVIIGGYNILIRPKEIAKKLGTEITVPLVVATCIFLIVIYINTYVCYIKSKKDFVEFSNDLVGKYITIIFVILYIIYFFGFSPMILRMSSEVIKINMLPKTPVKVITLSLLITIFYGLMKGLKVILKTFEIYAIIMIIFIFVIHILIFIRGRAVNLIPVFNIDNIPKYIKSIPYLCSSFLGIECLILMPIDRKENKNIFKYTFGLIIIVSIMNWVVTESCISVIGADDIVHYKDSVIATIRRVEIPYLEILRRIDGLFIVTWVSGVFCSSTVYIYACSYFIGQYTKNINPKLFNGCLIILVFILSRIPKKIEHIELVYTILNKFGFVVTIIIPFILFIAIKIRGYDKDNEY